MVRDIVIWPDPILKQPSVPVDRVDDGIRRLLCLLYTSPSPRD